jgi:hypothetical protein
MPTFVVWDCETDTALPRGTGPLERDLAIERSEVTVLCCLVFDSGDLLLPTGNWKEAREKAVEHTFWRDAAEAGGGPFDGALALFDAADAIVAYNGFGFDMRVLSKYYASSKLGRRRHLMHRLKLLDPMIRITQALDTRFPGLDDLLRINGLKGKSSNGIEAIRMWERGERGELEKYCMDDVEALSKLVFLPTLKVAGGTVLPNAVHGVASFVMSQRAIAPAPADSGWTIVEPSEALAA